MKLHIGAQNYDILADIGPINIQKKDGITFIHMGGACLAVPNNFRFPEIGATNLVLNYAMDMLDKTGSSKASIY